MNTPLRRLAAVVAVLFALLFASATNVQFVQAHALDAKPGNARTLYKNYGRERQPIILAGRQIAVSTKSDDEYKYLRRYPDGPLYAGVTGYYSVAYNSVTGMEAAAGSLLSGTDDRLFVRRVTDLLTGKPAKGATVELTLNARAQQAAWDALGNQRGAVVALDPSTGAILALVSKPSYDPNQLATHDSKAAKAAYTRLFGDPERPLNNRATGELYPPGSTFKLITAAAALESGDYDLDTEIDGPASFTPPRTKTPLVNDFPGACGPNDKVTLIEALRMSCNTAFGSLGLALGEPAMLEQAKRFGFGVDLKIPTSVVASQFPNALEPAYLAQSSIGQYDVRVTPMQMAMVSAAIANRGVLMKPHLVNRVLNADMTVMSRPEPEEIGRSVSRSTADRLTTMMERVVTEGTGTRAQIDGVRVAGKTGTAEHGKDAQGRERSPHAWFTAFAPADDPKIAVAVLVEDGGTLGDAASGGRVAAPIAKRVMEAVINQ